MQYSATDTIKPLNYNFSKLIFSQKQRIWIWEMKILFTKFDVRFKYYFLQFYQMCENCKLFFTILQNVWTILAHPPKECHLNTPSHLWYSGMYMPLSMWDRGKSHYNIQACRCPYLCGIGATHPCNIKACRCPYLFTIGCDNYIENGIDFTLWGVMVYTPFCWKRTTFF